MPATLPGGKLAPGARILIPGIRLTSPASPTIVHLKSGDWSASIAPIHATEDRIEAELPADLPTGDIRISVETSEGTSREEIVPAAHSSPGIFTLNGAGWGPVNRDVLRHRQKTTVRVSGLNDPHPKVFVGGVPARVTSVHGQQIAFEVPRNAPEGCWTPVWIESGPGLVSNFATLDIAGRDGKCDEPAGWPMRPVAEGKRAGIVIATRMKGTLELRHGQPDEFALDSAAGFFFHAGGGLPTPFQTLPPPGTCTSYTGRFSLVADMMFRAPRFIGEFTEPIDVGPRLILTDGTRTAKLPSKRVEGQYSAPVGGTAPVIWGPGTPLFLKPGGYRVRSNDMQVDVPFTVPPAFEWVNQKEAHEIDRSAGILLQWTGAGADRQVVIAAFNVHPESAAMGTLLCTAAPGATEMQIPPYALANFPPTDQATPVPIRGLVVATIPRAPSGVHSDAFDDLRSAFLDIRGQTVTFR